MSSLSQLESRLSFVQRKEETMYTGRIVVSAEDGLSEGVARKIKDAGFTVQMTDFQGIVFVITDEENLDQIRAIEGVRNADPDYWQSDLNE
jgi:hypothetical protein